jgi:hypothetical protein
MFTLSANRRVLRKTADEDPAGKNATTIRCTNHEPVRILYALSVQNPVPKLINSGGCAVVVIQHPAQALATFDPACASNKACFWAD